MGYDLHIVRTDNWLDAESNPITKEEVDRLLAAEPDLQWSTSDDVGMSDEDGTVERYYTILWEGEPVFWWYKAEIRCSNPEESQVIRMVRMAKALGAKVFGDDDERYELVKTTSGKEKLVTISA